MLAPLTSLLLAANLVVGAPVIRRAVTQLDQAATAEAQQRDNGATRAFSSIEIKTASGQCLFVDPLSGDFRENLTPVQVKNCDGSDGQKWDIITKGKHNDRAGAMLVVSAKTQACLNFDPRRAAGNQVLLFSCGGRADGGGQVTDSQLFPFNGGAGPLGLFPLNQKNTCITVKGGVLDQEACDTTKPTGNELFTFGNGGGAAAPPANPPAANPPAANPPAANPPAANPPAANPPATGGSVTPSNPSVKTGQKLDAAATAAAMQRDNTATRAFSSVPIKTAAGKCLFVDPTSGDFRENLIPIQEQPCDGSDGQKWDVITAGKHNDQKGTMLIVSSLTQGCMNFDDRRQPGNQVLLFSCGGRADGEGQVTNSQLFKFDGSATTLPFITTNKANVCLAVKDGLLDQTACDPTKPAANQIFTFGGKAATGGNTVQDAPPAANPPAANPPAANPPATGGSVKPSNPSVKTGQKLDAAATAAAMQRDDTATRAFSSVDIKTPSGKCLFVDPTSGDFRENLIPVQEQPCDGTAGQKWDVITAGKHNDQKGTMLVVSSLTQGCLNFDERRQPGNQVLLFSCGGRADGEGKVTNSQLFKFDGTSSTVPFITTNKAGTCLSVKDGLLDQSACDVTKPSANQLFTFGGKAAATPAPPAANPPKAADPPKAANPPAANPPATGGSVKPSNPSVKTGQKLDAAATAAAMQRDNTATRAFSSVSIKTPAGKCLFVDPTSGDFRENLIPVQEQPCDGSAGQKWDVITAGKHNDQKGTMLVVSALTQGCLNFDERRQPGNQVLLFSCGGRADGEGKVTNSQLFKFDGSAKTALITTNKAGTCLSVKAGLLDQSACDATKPAANQIFTFAK